MDSRSQENFLIHTMNNGFDKAAASFSQLISCPVKISSTQSILLHDKNDFSYMAEETGDLYILITQVIGTISGKSFLILNQEESEEIFRAIATSISNQLLREAFLLEIDNIISASVIAQLSNKFSIEIYGDVPRLHKVSAKKIQDFLSQEMISSDTSNVIFSNITFQFDQKEKVRPQFIWMLSDRIYSYLPANPILA